MSKRTYGHVLVLPCRRLVRPAADDDFVYRFYTCLFQPDTIHSQSTVSHIAFKVAIFLPNQCFDLVVKPRRVLVITDYILIWTEITKNIKYGFIEEV